MGHEKNYPKYEQPKDIRDGTLYFALRLKGTIGLGEVRVDNRLKSIRILSVTLPSYTVEYVFVLSEYRPSFSISRSLT